MSREPLETYFYSEEKLTRNDIIKVVYALQKQLGNNLSLLVYDGKGVESVLSRQKNIKRAASQLERYGGSIYENRSGLFIGFDADKTIGPCVHRILDLTTFEINAIDVRGAIRNKRWGEDSDPLKALDANQQYVNTVLKIIKAIGEKLVLVVGEDRCYHYHEDKSHYSYPTCVPQDHWIKFYGKLLLDEEMKKLLLQAPVFKAEEINSGVLIVNPPISIAYMPDKDDFANEYQEIRALAQYDDKLGTSEVYFKQHGLYEKLRKKVEEFDKQAKNQKVQ